MLIMNGYIIALDQGTTSSRSIIFDSKGNIVSLAQYPFTQIYPKPGWVEHDPMVILESQMLAMSEAFEKSGLSPTDIAGIGITNQRETTIVWDKNTGKPIYNAIVWQCRRTAPICDQLTADGLGPYVKEKTGLLIDAYFSGTKIKWILDNVPGARERAERGELLFQFLCTAAADERVDAPGLRVVQHLDLLRQGGQLRALEGELELDGIVLQFAQRMLKQELAAAHHAHVVAHVLQFAQVVRRDKHCRAALGNVLQNEAPHLTAHHGVETVHRLVEDEIVGHRAQREPEGRLLLLALAHAAQRPLFVERALIRRAL